jgi:hypothetical protein
MWKKLLTIALLIPTPTYAARCPHGQILRVHLNQCVSIHSKLAYAYVGRPVHVSLRRLIIEAAPVALPPKPADPTNSDTVKMMKAIIIPIPNF